MIIRCLAATAILLAAGMTSAVRAEGDAESGRTLFNRCSTCHAVTAENRAGPHLAGVFGRIAGTVPGARYSRAMAASGTVWDEETLDAFLAAPGRAMPGTSMGIGVPNPRDRADIIAYLETLPGP